MNLCAANESSRIAKHSDVVLPNITIESLDDKQSARCWGHCPCPECKATTLCQLKWKAVQVKYTVHLSCSISQLSSTFHTSHVHLAPHITQFTTHTSLPHPLPFTLPARLRVQPVRKRFSFVGRNNSQRLRLGSQVWGQFV